MLQKTRTQEDLQEEVFYNFIDDLGGYVAAFMKMKHMTYAEVGAIANLDQKTVHRIVNRGYVNSKYIRMYTCWSLLRACDNAGVIQHSRLEKYRGMSAPAKPRRKKRRASS